MSESREYLAGSSKHLIRIPDAGVTEQLVVFADETVLRQIRKTDTHILDVGCGRGVFTEKLTALGALVTGVDIDADEIDAAIRVSQSSNLTYYCLAAEDLSNLENRFNLIVSRFCFHHLNFPQAAESLKSCLVPGGRLFVVDCYQKFWSLRGRLFVLLSALKILGPAQFFNILWRLGYFFSPQRFAHVQSDIRRLKEEKRYTLRELHEFYSFFFPGCTIAPLGCAFSLSWEKNSNEILSSLDRR